MTTLSACTRMAALALGTAVLAAGCGRKVTRPEVFPAGGLVTLDGKPLEGARLSFEHEAATYWAEGRTDASGRYALMTFSGTDGALPGNYFVAITKYEDPATVPEKIREVPNYVPKNLLPARYATAKTSGLSATVEPRRDAGANRFDFKLVSQGK